MVNGINAEDTKCEKKSDYLGGIRSFLTKIIGTKVTFVKKVNTTLKVCKYVKKDVFS